MSDTPESPQGRRTAFLALILSTVVSLFAVEAMLQTADYPAPPKVGWGWAESPYADAQYRGQPPVNEQGLRGEPYGHSEAFTVLLVGDSYIEAGIQPPQDMPEAILRRMLREDYDITDARVVSLAGAGWGQGQQLQAMQDYFADHRADLVLAWLTPVNDYWENTFVDRSTSHEAGPLKPTLMRTNSAASDGWDWFDFSGSPLKLLQLVDLAMMAADATEDQAPVEQHFREMQSSQLPSTDRPARVDTACPERTIDQADLIREFRRDEGPMTVVTTELFSQGRSHFVPFSRDLSPLEAYQADLSGELLDRMRQTAESHDATIRFIYPKGSDIDRAMGSVTCVRDETGNDVPLAYGDALRHFRQSPVSDLMVETILPADEATILGENDWHLNRTGNILFLRSVLEQIANEQLLPERG